MATTSELKKIIGVLEQQEEDWTRMQKRLEKKVANAPEGSIMVKTCKGKYPQYYYSDGKTIKNRYLGIKDRQMIHDLLQKKYDTKLLRRLADNNKILRAFIEGFEPELLENVADSFSKEQMKEIRAVSLSDQEFTKQWKTEMEKKKENNPISFPLKGDILTEQGEPVRSKSEKIIADKLQRHAIQYVFEVPLMLNGYGVVYPDFTILDLKRRKTIYLEHFGMMDDEEYCSRNLKKIQAYAKNGLWFGEDLLYVFETAASPLSSSYLEQLFNKYLL